MAMDTPTPDIDPDILNRSLLARLTLRFPAGLEARFEAENSRARCRQIVIAGAISLLIFDLFLIADRTLVPDILPIAVFLRLGVMTPIGLMMLIFIWSEPRPWLREATCVVATWMTVISTLLLINLSSAPYRGGMQQTVICSILFATVVQRARFPYAVAACAGCGALFVGMLSHLGNFPPQLLGVGLMAMATSSGFALSANYRLERDARRAFITSLRERRTSRELGRLSLHDPLTGLANRRALDQRVGAMEASEDTRELAAIMIDIDHFKLFNDAGGHQAGDICIKRIAGLIRAELRTDDDLAFRYGGEEFVLLLPGQELPTAIAVAERIRRAVEAAAIPHPDLSLHGIVTVSAGVAAARLGAGLTAGEIIGSADAALYAAKRAGRNRVWPPSPRSGGDTVIRLDEASSGRRRSS